MPELVCIGEILVDMIPEQVCSYVDVKTFRMCFGGAPFNTAVGAARLGAKVAAICAIGNDPFGEFLLKTLRQNGVETSWVVTKEARTSLAFVVRKRGGERTFFFYRMPWSQTADTLLSPSDIVEEPFRDCRILHYSGVSLSHKPCRRAVEKAIVLARKAGAMVAFDPNIREDLWKSEKELKAVYEKHLKIADILFLAREEAEWIFGTSDPDVVVRKTEKYDLDYLCIKLGENGCYIRHGLEIVREPAFRVRVKDTTGAGDAWAAGFEVGLLRGLSLRDCARLANAIGALCVTKIGAISALPTLEEVRRFLRSRGCGDLAEKCCQSS